MPTRDELQVPVEVGGAPASPNGAIPERPGENVTLRAKLSAEYVAGTGYAWYAQYLRSLPWPIDELTADFGDDLYERMALDAQVAADVQRMKAAIIEDGVRLVNAVGDEQDDGYKLGQEIADTVAANLAELETSLDDVLWDLLDALMLGSRVAEQTYRVQPVRNRQLLALDALRVKPRRATAFVIDAYARVVGLLGMLPSGFSPVMIGTVLSDVKLQPNLIPRPKFAVLSWRPRDADPRGTSVCRPAYKPWWVKQQVIGDFLKYLAQFASPSIIGFTPPDSQAQALTDALGNVVNDPVTNQPVVTSPEQTMLQALQGWQNGTAAAFRGGAAVELVQSSGDGLAFLNAIEFCNREIGKAITTQSLATEEGQHDARAAAIVHQDALDTLIRQGKRAVERMVRFDIVRRLVLYNWGEKAARDLTPRVSLGRTEEHDFRQEGETVARLYAVGYIGESQKPGLDERLGLPVRDVDYDRTHIQIITQTRPERTVPTTGGPEVTQQLAEAELGATTGQTGQQTGQPAGRQRTTEGQPEKVSGT